MGARYRAHQFFKAISASVSANERELVGRALPPGLQPLFFRMAMNDQRHSLDVYRTLHDQGFRDDNLLAAALLHDCGKALGRIGVWQRVALVLAQAGGPWLLKRLPASGTDQLQRAFYVQREHARLGAELAAAAGAPQRVVDLILQHENQPLADGSAPDDSILAVLRRADSLN